MDRRIGRRLGWLLVLGASVAGAAVSVEAPREDGTRTPLRVYAPAQPGCAPLLLFSPGLGADERAYAYLAEALANDGWRVVVMGHRESGREPLRDTLREDGIKAGVRAMVTDPALYRDRQLDVGAALRWARRTCTPPFVALAGHSMGGVTTMIEAGARDRLGVDGRDRFDAYVVLSPEGPQPVFTEHAWQDVRKPVLMLTGTRDGGVGGDWHWRTQAYAGLPAGCAWLGVIDGAAHFNFGGVGLGHAKVTPLVVATTRAFLDGARAGGCPSLAGAPGLRLEHK
ncbi:MAG TPA: alpha/beta hydrolase [Mizugakiibacter sp.]